MFAKFFLAITAFLYFGLAMWCTVRPNLTSSKVGFELMGGSGKSEFVTVYGGLEFSIATIFLTAAFRSDMIEFGLLACTVIHGSLVFFRSLSFLMYDDIGPFTYRLAVGEWIIFLAGLFLIYITKYKS